MPPRLFVDLPLQPGTPVELPAGAVRHLQVLRLQPGAALHLFDGRGGEWLAQLLAVGRRTARVQVDAPVTPVAELPVAVTLAIGVPANDRMDRLVEKATELGVAAIQPLTTERSVLRLHGERAAARCAHWQAIAAAACEQCGRARVPTVAAWATLAEWLARPCAFDSRWMLSTGPQAAAVAACRPPGTTLAVLSGPEGGFAAAEVAAARAAGFEEVGLGPRVLRADTAPLALLAWIGLRG